MDVRVAHQRRLPRLGRLGWLMGLYAENHRKLSRLFATAELPAGTYLCHGHGSLPLRLEILAQHRFTTELRLAYLLRDPFTGEPDPSAHVRHYHDARQAEATHCHAGKRWQDVIGLHPAVDVLYRHRLGMNTFLSKWLDYLHEQGYAGSRLRRVD